MSPRPSGRNFVLRLTDTQRAALEVAAEQAGLTLAAWLREVALAAAGRPELGEAASLDRARRAGRAAILGAGVER